jgi:hypothetical protein
MKVNNVAGFFRAVAAAIAVCGGCWAQPLTITCSDNGVVNGGGTVSCSAASGVTWSLTPGSVGSIDPNTGVYTAPPKVTAKHQFAGCQIFPNNNMLNTRIDGLPLDPRSDAWIASIQARALPYVKFFQAMPFNIVTSDVPTTTMKFLYTQSEDGPGWWMPPYPWVRYQQGYFTSEAVMDRHLMSINRDTCEAQEIYNHCQNAPGCTANTATGGEKMNLAEHVVQKGFTDAAGLPILATTLKAQELDHALATGGEVKHAIRFTLSNNIITPAFVWPAKVNAYPNCPDISRCLPYGAMLRLKSTYDFTSPTNNPYVPILLNALKRYGIILGDGSSIDLDLAVDDTDRLNPLMRAAFSELQNARVQASNFEAVNQSSLRYAQGLYTVRPDSPHASSDDFAEVVATRGSTTAKFLLSLRGITVGVGRSREYLVAGSTAQITAWVHGTHDTALTYEMNPPVDGASVSSSGFVTAPAELRNPLRRRFGWPSRPTPRRFRK